jgi:N6-adenosine-specific RNA methylase IME4
MSEARVEVELKVDPELRSFCPALTEAELAQLEENLVAEGRAVEPLVTWQGTLLDGHNRHEICRRRGLPFTTREAKGVETREDALAWIVKNQLGRRNLTPEGASYLRGRRYNLEKKGHGGARATGKTFRLETAERLAREFLVTDRTIRNDGTFAAALDAVAENVGVELREKVLARGSSLSRAEVVELARLSPDEQFAQAQKHLGEVSPDVRRRKRRLVPRPPKGFVEEASAPAPVAPEPGRVFSSFEAIPSGGYACLYVDPPWELVPSHELAGMDLARLGSSEGARLWLWTTWSLLRRGVVLNLLKKWGFVWEGEAVWLKDGPATEVLLLARSRALPKRVGEGGTTLLTGAPDETGRPSGARELVAASASGPKIELFARRAVAGWDTFTPELVRGRDLTCDASRSPSSFPQPSQVA